MSSMAGLRAFCFTATKEANTVAEASVNAPMERLFRSLKTEWVPTVGYMSASLAQQDIGRLLMQHYNWQRPHQFNGGLAPAVAEEKLNAVSGMS
jgi:putative transposase